MVDLKFFKRPVLYAYGKHTFTTISSAVLVRSIAEWTTPAKVGPDACKADSNGNFNAYACARARASDMLNEIKNDIVLPVSNSVLDIIISWLR